MAKKTLKETPKNNNAPSTLSESVFFGLKLNDEQIEFRDAIYDKAIDMVYEVKSIENHWYGDKIVFGKE